MSVCQNPPRKRFDCVKCFGGMWSGLIPPECICDTPIPTIQEVTRCEHERLISLHCCYCAIKYDGSENVGKAKYESKPFSQQETITIKKALWDDMVEYKKKINELFDIHENVKFVHLHLISRLSERIEKLEQLEIERQASIQTQIKIENDFRNRIIKLEEKSDF